ncbi:MAG: hypothetical protein NTZ84_03655, partial [Candidatus Nealsonbacteria bacterium]|nr:hypothetical protein [Candidatus Nealsonbacteria bacterium]
RVFTVAKSFRAEPSITTRHLSEYVSLDVEMGFIESWQDLMDTCEIVLKDIFSSLEKNCSKELKIFETDSIKIEKIPRIKMREAQRIIFERTKRDNRKEPDLEPEDEKEICSWAKEKYGSELVFITHYPTKKRPFYTYADPDDPEYTLSFDLKTSRNGKTSPMILLSIFRLSNTGCPRKEDSLSDWKESLSKSWDWAISARQACSRGTWKE